MVEKNIFTNFLHLKELSCCCRFDKRITTFAEEKFRRDGIDVKTGSMVIKVTDKEISTKEMKNGEISSMPYGMTVWSTGIGTRPIIKDFMTQIGQVSLLKISTMIIVQVYLTNNCPCLLSHQFT